MWYWIKHEMAWVHMVCFFNYNYVFTSTHIFTSLIWLSAWPKYIFSNFLHLCLFFEFTLHNNCDLKISHYHTICFTNATVDTIVKTLSGIYIQWGIMLNLFAGKPTKPEITGILNVTEASDVTLTCSSKSTSRPSYYRKNCIPELRLVH